MAGNIPCILDKASDEGKGAVGCLVVEFFGLVLGALIFVYVGVKCFLGEANGTEDDLHASRMLRLGSEDEDSQSSGDAEQIGVDFETGLIGHGGSEVV